MCPTVGELAREMNQLGLKETANGQQKKKVITDVPLLPKLPSSSSSLPTHSHNTSEFFLFFATPIYLPLLSQTPGYHGYPNYQEAKPLV